jgi:glyceraldehyde 3-phosphate dehydrogenase
MGRMGRLALRAALGGVHRAADDPRAGNLLEVVHLNEIKGGAAATAHLLEFDSIHGRWHSSFEVDGDKSIAVGGRCLGFSSGPCRPTLCGAISAATSFSNAPASS